MKTIKARLSGTVQGVTFRQYIRDNANELNVRGFVRNLENGDVEVVAEGKDEDVNEFLNRCKQGPSYADIKRFNFEEIKHQGLKEFKILIV